MVLSRLVEIMGEMMFFWILNRLIMDFGGNLGGLSRVFGLNIMICLDIIYLYLCVIFGIQFDKIVSVYRSIV
jgi:hypothetical protein